jgi:sugar fermentation stimulation protein A
MHWHIDYLRDCADTVTPIPIRTSRRIECDLASALGAFLQSGPPGFGASDCDCPGHLFHAEQNPFHLPRFHGVLQAYRMRTPS